MFGRLLRLAGVASLLVLAACSSYFIMPAPSPIARTFTVNPSRTGVSPDALNAQTSVLTVGALQAPICQASQTCAALDAEQIPISCVKKIPYTNVLVPLGTTFKVLDQSGDFTCMDTGLVVNDKEVLTCHGPELVSFQLRLTNASCSAAGLVTGAGRCDNGYGYDVEHNCCAPMSTGSTGSTVVTISLGACPVPNP